MDFTEVRPYGNAGHTWGGVAVSMDGQIMLASITTSNAGLYLSTDGGANWACHIDNESLPFHSVCMSDDGQTIFAGDITGSWTRLSTDGGANWADLSALGNCAACDMTPSGKTIVALISTSPYPYRSDDYGATWNELSSYVYPESPTTLAGHISVSKDGNKLLVMWGGLFLSVDGGASWTEQLTAVSNPEWYRSTMSKDGTVMLAGGHINGANGGRLYLYKAGAWAEAQPMDANQHDWNAVSVSDAGYVLFAGMFQLGDGSISRTLWSSIDKGDTWQSERVIWPDYSDPEPTWNCITNRATTRVLAGTNGKRLWLSESLPLPPVIRSFPWVGKFQLSHVP